MKVIIGQGSCGVATGAKRVSDEFEKQIAARGLGIPVGVTGCVGTCYLEPIADVYDDAGALTRYVRVTPEKVTEIVEKHLVNGEIVPEMAISDEDKDFIGKQTRVVLRNCGIINPEDIREYIAAGGYEAAKKAIAGMTGDEVIEEIKVSGLRGRGGAGFPTWFKWNAAKSSADVEKYMVCNADEGDPGAFMDRSVLEGDPHSVIEGMIIGGYAVGAPEGVIYVRAEYPMAIRRLEIALDQARESGFLGENLFGTDFSFDIRIKAGAGAFVCGEETALIASLEGEKGTPRLRPPFPAQKGYRGKPTNVNNVETYANVPWIIVNGGAAFGAMGTPLSKGTKVFALAGKIKKGGLVEIPMGIPLREVIYGIGGGVKGDKKFKAVQLGGPSGGCIPASLIDTPVDYENITETGAIVGSGGMVVMDESNCMVGIAKFFMEFVVAESCGKCTPCRVGLVRMHELLDKITKGEGSLDDLTELEELAEMATELSFCALGQTAPNPVKTTLKYFRDEYLAHIIEKRCPAGECIDLLNFEITDACIGCAKCVKSCPSNAISGKVKEKHRIDKEKCVKCGACVEACPVNAIIRG